MPAEALLRLAYGRLDPEHTPAEVSGDPDVLDKLRKIFPGF
jgi:MDMPI C-terminal domain